jgi:hypothetical protein
MKTDEHFDEASEGTCAKKKKGIAVHKVANMLGILLVSDEII